MNYEEMRPRLTGYGLAKIQQAILIFFIMLSPIYKCFSEYTIFGYNPIVIVVGMVLLCYALNIFYVANGRQKRFFSVLILIAFVIELYVSETENTIGWVLSIFLYISFLQTDMRMSVDKLYRAFLWSAVIAAVFSVLRGLAGGTITRAAANVDGSIAPIALTIILFCDNKSLKRETGGWDVLKVVSLLSCGVVLIFGMSRARILVAGVLFAIYGLQRFGAVMSKNGQLKKNGVWALLGVFCVVVLLLISPVFQQIIMPIVDRFLNEGMESMGRDVEMEYAKKLFKANRFMGAGWGKFILQDMNGSMVTYSNHSAYMAILARGGLFLAVPMFMSYISLLVGAWKTRKQNGAPLVLMIVFLTLSYGNAGLFNYMICSLIPLVVLDVNKNRKVKPERERMLWR